MRSSLATAEGADDGIAPTFRDPARQAAFRRDGYVVLPCLDPAELELARSVWAQTHPRAGRGFQSDIVGRSAEATEQIERSIGAVWDRHIDRLLVDHERFMLSYLTKWPDDESEHHLHQDWTYVDERRHRTVSFWIALDDADADLDNGPVSVIPGSHHLVDAYRGPAVDDWYATLVPALSAHLRPCPVRAGDALVIDNALLHGSAPNRSPLPRRAVAAALAPASAHFLFAQPCAGDDVTIFDLGDRFFEAFDPAAPGLAERRAVGTAPRLVSVDHVALGALVGALPPDLSAAPAPAPSSARPAPLAATLADLHPVVAADHRAAVAAGARPLPATFLPDWSCGQQAGTDLAPLAHGSAWTAFGKAGHARSLPVLAGLTGLEQAAVATVPCSSSARWTATTPGGEVAVLLLDAAGPAGAVRAGSDGLRPAQERTVVVAASVAVENRGPDPVTALVVEVGQPAAGLRAAATARRRHRRAAAQADEVHAAVNLPAYTDDDEGAHR